MLGFYKLLGKIIAFLSKIRLNLNSQNKKGSPKPGDPLLLHLKEIILSVQCYSCMYKHHFV